MHKAKVRILLSVIATLIGAAMALAYGVQREKTDLTRLLRVLVLQIESEFSKTAALPSLLASHSMIIDSLLGKGASVPLQDFLDQQVLRTGQFSILLADRNGTVIAAGARNPDVQTVPARLAPVVLNMLKSGSLSRRFAPEKAGSGVYEAGLAIRQNGSDVLGYVVVADAFEDLAQNWRSMPDRLVLSSLKGAPLFATQPFGTTSIAPLRISNPSAVTGLLVSLERPTSTLFPYVIIGGSIAFLTTMIAILGASMVQYRRQMDQERIVSLARDARLLEQRVRERTQVLTLEISQRERVEATLKDKQAQLVQTAKFKVLGDMAAGLSHELSQPLFALQASLDTLEKQFEDIADPPPAALSRATRITQRMERILRNLRAFARNETEDPVPVDAKTPVCEALDTLSTPISGAGVRVVHDLPAQPLICLAGPVRLQQVVVNVISNAMDAMVTCDVRQISIDYPASETWCLIRIRDSGPGFEAPEKASEPFFTTKGEDHGLGLGLSISSEIMKSFGGSLSLGNTSEGGAEVILNLPFPQEVPGA